MGVDTALRYVLVALHAVTFGGGLMTSLGLGWVTRIFNDQCILYTDMSISMAKNNSVALDIDKTNWGDLETCYYVTFSTAMTSIYAVIWFWFYILLSEWDETNPLEISSFLRSRRPPDSAPPDSRLLFPTLLFNVIFWIVVAVSLGLITKGSNIWCQSILSSLNQPCSYVSSTEWINVQDGKYSYTYLRIAQAGNWILLFTVLSQILVVGCRVYLYLKLGHFSPRSSAIKHHSNTAKYVSFTEEHRKQLEQLRALCDQDDNEEDGEGNETEVECYSDIPFAASDTNMADAATGSTGASNMTEPQHIFHNLGFSLHGPGSMTAATSSHGLKRNKDGKVEDDSLLDEKDHAFKYNTL